MRFRITGAVAVLVLAAIAFLPGISTAEDEQPAAYQQQPPQAQEATVTKLVVKRPDKRVHRVQKFSPPAHPAPSYVFNVILPYEAARAGASLGTLSRRVACESGGRWYASNGQYQGIGQFAASTFSRGLSTIGSRKVTIKTIKFRRMHSRVYRYWSDGRLTRSKGRIVRQRIVTRLVGYMSTAYSDAWTQARIMAQANAGRSAVHDSEWECR